MAPDDHEKAAENAAMIRLQIHDDEATAQSPSGRNGLGAITCPDREKAY